MIYVRFFMQFIGVGCILFGVTSMFRDLVAAIRDIPLTGTTDYAPITGLLWFGVMLILVANNI